ncbi:cytochrome P450 2C16-like [Styela clava]|uniref:cytochrome P450 2C16-like n=1 Tax=Styela clava TaxID=7725 RepID=UPI001939604F|nr:cytochrome P450 2C16-like [Styela clava]
MISILVAFAVIVLSCLYWYRRDSRLPPGPKGVPLLGVIPFLRGHSAKRFREWSKEYGNVFSARVGPSDYLVLTDYDVIHEVLIKQGNKVENRPPLPILDACSKGHGILFAKPRVWTVHRPFVVNTLRKLGMGKKLLESRVLDESSNMIAELKKQGGNPYDPKDMFLLMAVNVAALFCMGQRFAFDDEDFKKLVQHLVRGWQDDGDFVILLGYCAYLRHIPPFRKVVKNFVSDFDYVQDTIKKYIHEHELTYDKNDIRDFIDAFIEETKKERHDRTFTEEQLIVTVRDLLDAGAQTTSCTLVWILVGLVSHPDWQDKIREEIKEVVGEHGAVTMGHREKMPKTVAFLYEVMRKAIMAAQSHVCTTDEITVKGYKIPKHTPVFAAMWVVHNNPKYFDNPEEFRPERFINPVDGSFMKSKYCNPFSIGKRGCAGEQLAQMELFIFITHIVQNFNLSADDKTTIPSFDDGTYGIVYVPPRFKIKFEEI